MVAIGYTLMCEQRGPGELVEDAVAAERAGFEFAVISDHFHPWLEEQGHSGYAWSILGAIAQATESLPLMTYVTCPTFRYHPAVVPRRRRPSPSSPAGALRWASGRERTLTSTSSGAAGRQ